MKIICRNTKTNNEITFSLPIKTAVNLNNVEVIEFEDLTCFNTLVKQLIRMCHFDEKLLIIIDKIIKFYEMYQDKIEPTFIDDIVEQGKKINKGINLMFKEATEEIINSNAKYKAECDALKDQLAAINDGQKDKEISTLLETVKQQIQEMELMKKTNEAVVARIKDLTSNNEVLQVKAELLDELSDEFKGKFEKLKNELADSDENVQKLKAQNKELTAKLQETKK